MIRACITCLMLCLLPIAASAQTTAGGAAALFDPPLILSAPMPAEGSLSSFDAAQGAERVGGSKDERLAQDRPASQGPMIVERVHSGFLVAPDFKVTEVDKKTSELVGGYAGWLTDGKIFVGGGGYWLANQSRDREMAYGGLIVQWLARTSERFGFSARGLVGGGRATLSGDFVEIQRLSDRDRTSLLGRIDPDDLNRARITNGRIRFREDFFVAEPEVGVLVRLTKGLRLTGGAGYRFTANEGRDDNRLRGAVGSVGLQIGGGS